MTRYENLAKHLLDIDEKKKGIVLSLLSDFVCLEEQIERLRMYPRFIVDPDNPRRQKKLPMHDILKDLQAQKTDIAGKLLRILDGEVGEDSPLLKALSKYNE